MTIAGDDVDALIVQIKEFVEASVIGESDYDSLLAAKCLLIKLVTRLYYRTHSIIVLLHSICFFYIYIRGHNQEHHWFSGKISACHAGASGSIDTLLQDNDNPE